MEEDGIKLSESQKQEVINYIENVFEEELDTYKKYQESEEKDENLINHKRFGGGNYYQKRTIKMNTVEDGPLLGSIIQIRSLIENTSMKEIGKRMVNDKFFKSKL